VLCGVKSLPQLHRVRERLTALGIPLRTFSDADLGGDLTALATAPLRGEARRRLRRYQCLRETSLRAASCPEAE
jgi:hypothetical protein